VIELRPTSEADLDFVLALESHPDNAPFIGQWSRDEHRETIARPDREHWILAAPGSDERLGYLIALDLREARCGVYVKRIVSAPKSQGVGRAALARFARHAFDDLGATHVWLSVHKDNLRGQRCYYALGFGLLEESAEDVARHDAAVGRDPSARSLRLVLRPP
jgi:ribosomal protein S18 acetylase RimI-like enzyme